MEPELRKEVSGMTSRFLAREIGKIGSILEIECMGQNRSKR